MIEQKSVSGSVIGTLRTGNSCARAISERSRRKRTEAERAALEEAATRPADVLAARGVTGDELVADFKKWRAATRK
jgi:hypothetical protein